MAETPGLYYSSIGSGPPLVLLHGWGLHSAVWRRVSERLAISYRVTSIDLPGHGKSQASIPLDDPDATCAAFHRAAPRPAIWVGWSLGGLLALAYSSRYPQAVGRLILVAAGPRFIRTDARHGGLDKAVLTQFQRGLQREPRATLRRFLALQVTPDQGGRAVLRVLRGVLASHRPNDDTLSQGLGLLAGTDLRHELAALTMPVRMILGAMDRVFPVDHLKVTIPAALESGCSILPASGHAPFLDQEQAFMDVLVERLNDRF